MKLKNLYYLFFLLFVCSISFGQDNTDILRDSLRNILATETSSTNTLINTSIRLHHTFSNVNYDSAFYYANNAYDLSIGTNDTLAIKTLVELGNLAYLKNNYTECYNYINEGIVLSKKLGVNDYLMDLYNVNGSSLQEQGQFNEAMDNYMMSKEIAVARKDTYGLTRVIVNLSFIYYRIKDYDKVFTNTKEAIKIAKEKNYDKILIYAYNMLGGAYETVDNPVETLKYYKKSYHLADSLKMSGQKATALVNIAGEYSKREQYNEAIDAYSEAKEIFEYLNDQRGKYEVIGSLGELYLSKNNYKKAISHCEDAYEFSNQNSILYEQEVTCECLYKIYKTTGQHDKALFYHEKYKTFSDSMFSAERKSELTNIELTYQFDREKDKLKSEQKEKEIILENKNNTTKYIALLFSLLAILSLISFIRTRRKNKLIGKQKEELEAINTTKDKLFAIIGHDLKRPAMALKGISTKVKYLLDNQDYERLNRFGNQIEENANSFNAIVNNLLHWALLQKDVMPYNPKQISLKEITNHVLSIYQTATETKNIKFTQDIPEDVKLYVDEVALNAVITNLVDNAIKFTDEGGEIRITGSHQSNKTTISIKDSGTGFTKSQLDKIFSLVKNKTQIGTKGELGTGLGLHLVFELVKLNKGEIDVNSEFNKGTTFNLSFPQS